MPTGVGEEDAVIYFDDVDGLLDLDAAITKLARWSRNWRNFVELRYFAGFTVEETARAGVSPSVRSSGIGLLPEPGWAAN